MNRVVFGQNAYNDLDIADDVSLLAELLSLLIPVLEAFAEEAAAIGLEVNWDKTKVQALGTQQPDTETLDVHGHQVAVVDTDHPGVNLNPTLEPKITTLS